MRQAFWPQKTMSPRLLRADLGRADSPRLLRFRGPPVQVEWQFLFGICTKKPALRARDRWWLLLRLACELRRASLCHAPARRARSLLQFVSQSQQDWNGCQDAAGQEGQAGTASFVFFQTVAEKKTNPHSQRASRHRDEPNLRQRQSDAFRSRAYKLCSLSLIRSR